MNDDERLAESSPARPRSNRGYEFSDPQNRVIAELAAKMLGVGLFTVVMAVACWGAAVALAVQGEGGYVIALVAVGVFLAGTGALTLRSQRAFRRIVDTAGHDIEHTMEALRSLQLFYRVKFWLVVVCLAAVLLSLFQVR